MPHFDEPYWEKEIKDARLKNIADVPNLLKNREAYLMKKIKFFSERTDIPEHEVISDIQQSRTAAAQFAKDPKRQNIYEKISLEFMKGRAEKHGINIVKLPQGETNALYLDENGAIRAKRRTNDRTIGKALDFVASKGNQKVYISHKYTGEPGGMQGSQSDEQLHYMKKFAGSEGLEPGVHFAAVCDGQYYEGEGIQEIKSYERRDGHLSKAGTTGEVLQFIIETLKNE